MRSSRDSPTRRPGHGIAPGPDQSTRLPDLRGLTLEQLEAFAADLELPRYRAAQLFRWVHRFGATSWDEMTNVPRSLRTALGERVSLAGLTLDTVLESVDGTRKLALRCADGAVIEAVLIPRDEKLTLCVSSQVGCALGCAFCATATMGLRRNLAGGEILDQVYCARRLLGPEERITHLVFMGMGEPLANLQNVMTAVDNLCAGDGLDFSARRITVSTVGLVPGLAKLGRVNRHLGLAVSLHATTNAVRDRLIPANKRWPLETLMAALREFPLPRRRRITFEYLVLPRINDTRADVNRLAKLLDGIPSKINLLPYNPCRPDHPELTRPSEDQLQTLAENIRAKGLTVTVRHSRGLDIAAACGQLAVSQ